MYRKVFFNWRFFRCVLASLYEGPSVRPFVHWSVGPVRNSFFFEYAKTRVFGCGKCTEVGDGEGRAKGGGGEGSDERKG